MTFLKIIPANCSICEYEFPNQDFVKNYIGIVCKNCEQRSLNVMGEKPTHNSILDIGDNPIYIDGFEFIRRYRFGGFVTTKK